MNTKYLSFMLASIAIAVTLTPAFATSKNKISQTISCQTNGETPTTIAKRANGEDLTIFHWRDDVLPENLDPQQLCEDVSAKLQNYATEGNQLYSFRAYNYDGFPMICAEEKTGDCNLVLLTLEPTNNQEKSKLLLSHILDSSLKGEEGRTIERGVQSYGYKVSFWSLLGF